VSPARIILAVAAALCCAVPAHGAAKLQIVFPVVGEVTYVDDFGDARGTSKHEGNDLMAPKRATAVAAEGGTVSFWTTSASAGCMLYLHGDSGTTYWYIHLNNDRTRKNDNRGKCVPGTAYAKGLHEGDRVEAGQAVGYVGDSGDADGLHAHLHFEIHPRNGKAVDPFRYLKRAQALGGAGVAAPPAVLKQAKSPRRAGSRRSRSSARPA
jgi:murein DD-endopeptidase MepM/ murein hydrolase activator NlpD